MRCWAPHSKRDAWSGPQAQRLHTPGAPQPLLPPQIGAGRLTCTRRPYSSLLMK